MLLSLLSSFSVVSLLFIKTSCCLLLPCPIFHITFLPLPSYLILYYRAFHIFYKVYSLLLSLPSFKYSLPYFLRDFLPSFHFFILSYPFHRMIFFLLHLPSLLYSFLLTYLPALHFHLVTSYLSLLSAHIYFFHIN